MELTFVGSLEALGRVPGVEVLADGADTVVLATAAAFRGAELACHEVRVALGGRVGALEVLSVADRRASDDPAVVARLRDADLIVVVDGAPLHARSVWRSTALGRVLGDLPLVCVGSVGSVLGATMIDPRGGAPTTGVGVFDGVVLSVVTTPEQAMRTRGLVGPSLTLVELGPRAVVRYDGTWSVAVDDGLVITRGGVAAAL